MSTGWGNTAYYSDDTTLGYFIVYPLSHTGLKPGRQTYERKYVTIILLAAYGPWRPHLRWEVPDFRIQRRHPIHKRIVQLLPPNGPFDFVALDILGPLRKKNSDNRVVVIVKDLFSEITMAISTKMTTDAHVAETFLYASVMPYRIPNRLSTDNEPQFSGKFFNITCGAPRTQLLTTTSHHPRTSGQTQQYGSMEIKWSEHYITYHQNDWNDFIQPQT